MQKEVASICIFFVDSKINSKIYNTNNNIIIIKPAVSWRSNDGPNDNQNLQSDQGTFQNANYVNICIFFYFYFIFIFSFLKHFAKKGS